MSSHFFRYSIKIPGKTEPIIVSLSTDFELWDIGDYLDIFYSKSPFYVHKEDTSITNEKIPTITGWTLISIVNKDGGKIYRYNPISGADPIDYILRNNRPIMPVFTVPIFKERKKVRIYIMELMINAENDRNKIIDKPRAKLILDRSFFVAWSMSNNKKAADRRKEGREIWPDGWGRDLGEHEHAPEAGSILSALPPPPGLSMQPRELAIRPDGWGRDLGEHEHAPEAGSILSALPPPPGLSMPPRELAIRPGRRRNENEPGDDEFFTPPSSPPSSSKGGKKNRRTKTTRRGKTTRRTTKRKNRRTTKRKNRRTNKK